MKKIIVGSSREDLHEQTAREVFGSYLDNDLSFLSTLDDDRKEVFLRSAHFLKFYVHDLNTLVKEKWHLRDIYGYLGLTSLVEFCSQSDPRFAKGGKERAFINYLSQGMSREESNYLVGNLEIHMERRDLSKKKKIEVRLKLLYEFRSEFVHHLHLPPTRRSGTSFIAHFHESNIVKAITTEKDQRGVFLTIKLSLRDYLSMVEKCILRNLGYKISSGK